MGEREMGFIYFVEARGTGLVKIGWTAGDPRVRLRTLQTSNGCELRLLATRQGTVADEKQLQQDFREDRERAEWFRLSPHLQALLWNVGGGDPPSRTLSQANIEARIRKQFAWLIERKNYDQVRSEAHREAIATLV
jgi:hypothetical protein